MGCQGADESRVDRAAEEFVGGIGAGWRGGLAALAEEGGQALVRVWKMAS